MKKTIIGIAIVAAAGGLAYWWFKNKASKTSVALPKDNGGQVKTDPGTVKIGGTTVSQPTANITSQGTVQVRS